MEFIGYIGAIIIGLTLGLIGGGGSILAVPIFVYLFSVNPAMATAYSLFVVGASSVFGASQYYRNNLISLPIAIIFGLPSIATIFLTRRFLLPAIPYQIIEIGGFELTKDIFLLLLFALLMLGASYKMIFSSKTKIAHDKKLNYIWLAVQGSILGIISGLVGAGGGFIIIPALILFAQLPTKKAIGTSLLIISVNSLIGFLSDVHFMDYDWTFLLTFTALAIVGILIGIRLSKKIEGNQLKPAFGWFILIMGIFIITKELIFQ